MKIEEGLDGAVTARRCSKVSFCDQPSNEKKQSLPTTMPPRFPVHTLTSEPALSTAAREAKSL